MKCAQCGNKISGGAKFCGGCGAAVQAEASLDGEYDHPQGKSLGEKLMKNWLFVLGVIVVLLTILSKSMGGSSLDEAMVSQSVLEILNEKSLPTVNMKFHHLGAVKAKEVASLDLEKKGKRWIGLATVEFSREQGGRSTVQNVKVEVSPKGNTDEVWIQVSFEDSESAYSDLTNL